MGSRLSFLKRSKNVLPDNPTRFEDLSNELAYDLFDYFSYHEITFSFGQLNNRFDGLIDTYPHHLNLRQYAIENYDRLPQQIRSLKISARYQVSFVDSFDLTSLRALFLSNIKAEQCTHILSSIPVEQLRYIYLSLPNDEHGEDVKSVQRNILSLGQTTLKQCTFRMQLALKINELPTKLVSLEYFQLHACKPIPFINALLARMPNLKSFRGTLLTSDPSKEEYSQPTVINTSLTHVILRVANLKSPMELISFFMQHCANVRHLALFLTAVEADDMVGRTRYTQFVDRSDWTTRIIPKYLPQLRNFQISRCVRLNQGEGAYQPCKKSPYHERLSCPPIDVFIGAEVARLWQKTN